MSLDLPPSTEIGSYRILRRLGAGGMGAVYLAEHRHLSGHQVAIKCLGDPSQATSETVARFRLEAETLSRLQHPHIVRMLDFGFFDQGELAVPYIAMEFLPGGDLETRLAQRRCLSHEETAGILLPILDALAYAHGRGVIHRDLKPPNMLFDSEGRPKLADFGLVGRQPASPGGVDHSGASIPLTRVGFTVGTPGYMSPEQSRGEPLDRTSDLYAVGLIYFRCVTGRLPALQELPTHVERKLPPIADRIFSACIAPKGRRPRDAHALKALFAEAAPLAQGGVVPLAPTVHAPGPRVPRWPSRVLLGALVGLVPGTAIAILGSMLGTTALVPAIAVTTMFGALLGAIDAWWRAIGALWSGLLRPSPPQSQSAGWLVGCPRCSIPVIRGTGCCPRCGSSLPN